MIIMLTLIKGTIFGIMGWFVIDVLLDELALSGKPGADIIDNIIPLLFALGIVIFVVMRGFKMGNEGKDDDV